MAEEKVDTVMVTVKEMFSQSGLSLEQLGLKMGYDKQNARKSAWQFLNRTNDPRLSMLRRFAEAFEISVSGLLEQETKVS